MSGKRRVRGAEALAEVSVTTRACRNPAVLVAGHEQPWCDRIRLTGLGEGRGGIVGRKAGAIRIGQLFRDPTHLRVSAATVGVSRKLSYQISGVDRRQPWCASPVALSAKAVTREAGILRACPPPAQGNKLTGLSKAIARARIDRAARSKSDRRCRANAAKSKDHRDNPTCVPTLKFRTVEYNRTLRQIAIAGVGLSLVACKPPPQERPSLPLADAARGKLAIERVGCGSCHTIEGVRWPQGRAAPELRGLARRAMIAGHVPNRPDLLAAFVRNAPAIAPGTTMPAMPLSEQESRDIAAYLYEVGR